MAFRSVISLVNAALAVLILNQAQIALASSVYLGGDVTVATDYVFRGVSQSMSSPVLQGNLTLEHENGWYANAWASNIDFTQDGDPDDGARLEVDIELGYYRASSDRTAVSLSWANYLFPGTEPGVDYNYSEILGGLSIDEQHYLTIGYSDDVFASGERGVFFAIGTSIGVKNTTLGAEFGYYDLDRAYDASYQYGELSLSGSGAAFDWRLSYVSTSNQAGRIYYESTLRDRLVLGISKSFGQGN